MKRFLTAVLCMALIACLLAGCGASAPADVQANAGAEAPMYEEMATDKLASNGENTSTPLPENRKWVITSEVRAETGSLDELMEAVLKKVSEMSGYVEDQDIHNGRGDFGSRMARLTIRVPAQRVDEFLAEVSDRANVVSSSKNLEDITLQYVDTQTRLQALKTEEERLLELMEQAETMSDLLEIEARLTDVHYELENVTSRMRTYDNQVNYATIYLTMEEVAEFTPVEKPGFLERIGTGFMDSLEGVWDGVVNFLVLIIAGSPYLVVWGLIILVIVYVVRRCTRKKNPKASRTQKPVNWDSPGEEQKEEKK